jgi:hypothetical protein
MATDQLGAFLTRRTAWTSSIETAKLPRCSDGRRLPHVSMECDHAPLARIFWSILAIEIIGFGVMMISAARTGGHTPEGPVGGWLIFIPPVFWAVLALLFYGTDSSSKRLTYTVLLALPLIQALVGPIYGTVQNVWWERGRAGADYFSAAPLRLANAIYDHDVERVIRLIPAAGDLNTPHGNGMTLFDFAMSNTDDSDASLKDHPGHAHRRRQCERPSRPSVDARALSSPRFVELLLDAGANPNAVDEAQRPVWWTVLSAASDNDLTKLRLLLDRGADLKKRDREGGPVAWAAY